MPKILVEITIIFLAGYLAAKISFGAKIEHNSMADKSVKEQHVI